MSSACRSGLSWSIPLYSTATPLARRPRARSRMSGLRTPTLIASRMRRTSTGSFIERTLRNQPPSLAGSPKRIESLVSRGDADPTHALCSARRTMSTPRTGPSASRSARTRSGVVSGSRRCHIPFGRARSMAYVPSSSDSRKMSSSSVRRGAMRAGSSSGETTRMPGATSIVEPAGSSADMTCVRTRSLPILAEAEETRSSRG